MSRQPTRQLSLQQPAKRAQVRRQRSADDNQPVKSRRDKTTWGSMERPKVRIAWGSQAEDTSKVEVIASRIGTTNRNPRSNGFPGSSVMTSDKSAILYSRQELAERLRLAWKQREANKANIDIFLAHDTTVEERCDSRLSTSSCLDSKGMDDEDKDGGQFNERKSELENCAPESQADRQRMKVLSNDKEVKVNLMPDARTKRASFQSGTNLAFTGPVQKNTLVSPIIKDARDRSGLVDARGKRTNSAPPLQRRTPLLSPANLPNVSNRPRVNIIIDTPKIGRPREFNAPSFKFERKDSVIQKSSPPSPHQEEKVPSVVTTPPEKAKSTGNKKRARSGKRRVDDAGRKSELSKNNNPDVVTMVSLVSDADSDSEVEKNNSPRDDKLVRQLRSNLATTPIIKNSSSLLMNVGNLNSGNLPSDSSNTLMPRRVLKSVSFQQDSIDGELELRPKSAERKTCEPKVMIQQTAQLIRSSGDEMRTAWQEITNVEISGSQSSVNYWDDTVEISSLTEREKRCLVVPIGDQQDKKRKLLLQRTKSVPVRADSSEECSTSAVQLMEEIKEKSSTSKSEELGEGSGVSIQSSITKLIDGDSFRLTSVDVETADVDIQDVEPLNLRTTKEKECWHLYRRMCDKGVCVSFDTVLRGMLTPTEYRLRKREPT